MSYALITGASKGIGKEIAAELASRKYNLLLIARSEELLQKVASELKSRYKVEVDYLAIDLAQIGVAQQVYDWVNTKNYEVSILVNNAGYGLVGPLGHYSIDKNRDMMTLNMLTLTEMCQTFLPMLKRQSKSYIMNIASSTAYQALPHMAIYAATKVFVLNFTRALKHELDGTSVSVTAISPGSTATDFNDRAEVGEKAMKAAEKVMMTPTEVAQIAVKSMFGGSTEVVTGFINKLGAFMAWLAPKSITEKVAKGIYEK